MTTSPDSAPIAVIGGGLAGLTAALDLAERQQPTILFERRPFVGGKAFSFTDPNHDVVLDNGQHITMRCCTEFDALLRRIGLRDIVRYQRALNVRVIDPESAGPQQHLLARPAAARAAAPRLVNPQLPAPQPQRARPHRRRDLGDARPR